MTETNPNPDADKATADKAAAAKAAATQRVRLDHLDGCPKKRTESFEASDRKGEPVPVTRCIDCGAQKAG